MTLTVDEQLWSAAAMVLKRYGDDAPVHVAERLGALAPAGDAQGVEAWQLIAARIDQLKTCEPSGAFAYWQRPIGKLRPAGTR